MKLNKCETEREYAKGISVGITIVGIPLIVIFVIFVLTMDLNLGERKDEYIEKAYIIIFAILIFLFIEVMYLLMWYPYLCNRKKALYLGEKYDGKILSINYHKKAKWLILRQTNYFTLTIQYEEDNEVKKILSDVYIGGPLHYIPRSKECKVYVYKGKVYVQDFTYIDKNEFTSVAEKINKHNLSEGNLRDVNMMKQVQAVVEPEKYLALIDLHNQIDKTQRSYTKKEDLFKYSNESLPYLGESEFNEAVLERECVPIKYSNEHILTPALIISKDGKRAYVFVELSIVSYIPYCYEDLGYFVDLCKYLDSEAYQYFDGNSKEFIQNIRELIERKCNILVTDNNYFRLKDVLISVRNIK